MNKKRLIFFILCIIFLPLYLLKINIKIDDISDLLLFFITINSILCGFSTNNESKILSITSEKIIQELKGTGIIREREALVLLNFKVSVVTILLSSVVYLLMILNFLKNLFILKIFVYFLILFTIVGVFLFVKSSSKIKNIIKIVYDDTCPYTEDEIKKTKKDIENLK